jgi:hypothetical protein
MAGASIEATLELWASSLRDVKARMRPLFTQERVATSAGQLLDGLLGEERRKTGWMRAEAAGDPGPWRQQAILGRGRWDADALRDIVRDYALETLADDDAVLVIDETGFLKQGKASCGVGRQYTGSAGKITNCQIGVFACYVSRHGHAFIDRALYLPKAWTDDQARMKAAHVPAETRFATKPALAGAMIERALAAKTPFGWVAADSVYGVGNLETTLRQAGKGYVLGISSDHRVNSWGKARPIAGTAGSRGVTFLILMNVGASYEVLLAFAVMFGVVDYATVPVTASLVASHLGLERMGLTMGLISAGHSVGGALGAFVGGYVFDSTATYTLVWWSGVWLAILAGLMILPLGDRREMRTA